MEPQHPYAEPSMPSPAPGRGFPDPAPSDPLQFSLEPAERWIEEPSAEEAPAEGADRGPALWRRRPARRLRLPDRYDDFRLDGRNPLDIPTFLRKQMD
jgi:hypothetical protein